MFIDKDSIVINGISIGKYLVQAEYQHNKLWGKNSGRNLAGKQKGTLIGIFPKLVLQFRKLSKEELVLLAPVLDSAEQSTKYFDVFKNQYITISTYTGDWKYLCKNKSKADGFSCSFIAREKRS